MSLIDYHRTTIKELLALTNKVRNLISHWGEDGRFKEAVLKNVIRRFLPEKLTIGTGFVIKQTNNRGEHLSSRQIDLLIYDDASPVLFNEGDFVILTPDANPHSLYNLQELSFSFFISNLTDYLSNKSVKKNNFIW